MGRRSNGCLPRDQFAMSMATMAGAGSVVIVSRQGKKTMLDDNNRKPGKIESKQVNQIGEIN